jgi:CubicO group peptidase (beta-lactamase class C family)
MRPRLCACIVALFLFLPCLLHGQLPAPKGNPQLTRFRGELEHLRQALLIPGLSVAIVQDGNILWAGGLGYRDEAAHLPATEHTRYPIASLTKSFTAVTAMQLVEHKRLNLEDFARKFGLEDGPRVRVRHYLSQMSEVEPGTRFLYNGDRYNRLTTILETASGKPLGALFENEIFRPAGMSETTAGAAGSPDSRKEIAQPYSVTSEGRITKLAYSPAPVEAASGIVSSAIDLAKFDAALDANTLLKPALKWDMWAPAISQLGPTPYGLGWFVETWRAQDLVWHYGQLPGYSALFLKIPRKRLTLILLANSSTLSSPFPLQFGQVLFSPFASAFLRDFVVDAKAEPDWNASPDVLQAQLTELEKTNPGYSYQYELASRAYIAAWRDEKVRSATLFQLALHQYPGLLSRQNEPAFLFSFARNDDPTLQKLGERISAALLAQDPGNARTRFDVGVLLVREKRCPSAVPQFETVLAREDAFTPIRAWSGYMLAECVADKNPREAESVLHRVLLLKNNADGVLDDSQKLLDRLQENSPHNPN